MAQETINRNLYWLRTVKELRQEDVANALNISRSAYLFYEDDRAVPEELFPMLSKLFETSVQDLLHKELMPPDILEAYTAKRAQKKSKAKSAKKNKGTEDQSFVVDRSFINEVLLRNSLKQQAKILSILQDRQLQDLEREIDADNLEVMHDLITRMQKMGKGAFVPVFSSSSS